jgi:glycosyltransferase involved in cell wall biosynthesis
MVITIDADGQHDPKDIARLVEPIFNNKADVVIGTRMLNTKGMPALKIFGNWFMNLITFLVYRKWSTDSQSGMRAYSKKSLGKISLHSIGYEVCSEIIGEVKRTRLVLVEVPIQVIYSEYSNAKGQNWINGINILTRSIAIKMANKK